jgi:F420-dependent oxidoreductase-like protein
MRIGLQIPNFTYPGGSTELGAKLKAIVQTADDGGFYSLWVMDHFFQIRGIGDPSNDMLESYSTLSYFAGLTSRVKLGALVTGVIYRYPGILLKTVTTLDVLSSGRAYFGVGAAWFEDEARGLGVPYPSTAERFERLEETLKIARQMWSGSTETYLGEHFQLENAMCRPLPLSKPHPPIMIGGMGERKTLRLVAQYADANNLFLHAGIDTIKNKLATLKQHCEVIGRPYSDIEKTALGTVEPGKQSAAEIIEICHQSAEAGIEHIIFNMPNVHEIAPLELFAREIIPAVAELQAAH